MTGVTGQGRPRRGVERWGDEPGFGGANVSGSAPQGKLRNFSGSGYEDRLRPLGEAEESTFASLPDPIEARRKLEAAQAHGEAGEPGGLRVRTDVPEPRSREAQYAPRKPEAQPRVVPGDRADKEPTEAVEPDRQEPEAEEALGLSPQAPPPAEPAEAEDQAPMITAVPDDGLAFAMFERLKENRQSLALITGEDPSLITKAADGKIYLTQGMQMWGDGQRTAFELSDQRPEDTEDFVLLPNGKFLVARPIPAQAAAEEEPEKAPAVGVRTPDRRALLTDEISASPAGPCFARLQQDIARENQVTRGGQPSDQLNDAQIIIETMLKATDQANQALALADQASPEAQELRDRALLGQALAQESYRRYCERYGKLEPAESPEGEALSPTPKPRPSQPVPADLVPRERAEMWPSDASEALGIEGFGQIGEIPIAQKDLMRVAQMLKIHFPEASELDLIIPEEVGEIRGQAADKRNDLAELVGNDAADQFLGWIVADVLLGKTDGVAEAVSRIERGIGTKLSPEIRSLLETLIASERELYRQLQKAQRA